MNIQKNIAALLSFFLILHLVNESNAGEDPCIYSSNPRGIINITSLGRADGIPMWKNIHPNTTDNHVYSYNPCYSFNQSNCKDVAGCQTYATDETLAYPLGSQSSVQWLHTAGDDPPALTYTSDERKLYVNLRCLDSGEPDQLEAYGYDEIVKMFVLTLSSKCACWNGCIDEPTNTTTTSPYSNTTISPTPSGTNGYDPGYFCFSIFIFLHFFHF